MNWAGVKVGVGTKFMYDSEIIEIVEMHTFDGAVEVVAKDLRAETVRRFALSELMFSERARLLAVDLHAEVAGMTGDPVTVQVGRGVGICAAGGLRARSPCPRSAHRLSIWTCGDRVALRATRRLHAGVAERKAFGCEG